MHSIAAPPSPILANASHCRATKSYLSQRIPSPAPPYLILASASLPHHHSVLVSTSLPRHHSISAGASPPCRNFCLGQRIIAMPPFCLGQRIIAAPQFLSWQVHNCRTAISYHSRRIIASCNDLIISQSSSLLRHCVPFQHQQRNHSPVLL
jgi:hypothetical protein